MRQQFIAMESGRRDCPDAPVARNAREAKLLAPWAAKLIRCEGGWQAFESVRDAETWRRQV